MIECLDCGPTEGCEHITIKGDHVQLHLRPTLRLLYPPGSRPNFAEVFAGYEQAMIRMRQEQDARERAMEASWEKLRRTAQRWIEEATMAATRPRIPGLDKNRL